MSQSTRPRAWAFRRVAPIAVLLAAAAACVRAAEAPPSGQDPLHTDGDKYRLLFENQLLRVLRYHDEPGSTTQLHYHPCFLLYALGPFQRELSFKDGRRVVRSLRAGETAWMPAQQHVGHNTGRTPTDALLFELKGPCG